VTAALVAPEAVAAELGRPGLVVLDTTADLARPAGGGPYRLRPGRAEFETAHVPGARFADLVDALAQPAAPHPFAWPSPERFAAGMGALGVGAANHVVVYAQGTPMWATRLWFLLRAHGFDDVRVLDGGLAAWRDAGLPVESGPAAPASTAMFPVRLRPQLLASRADVEAAVTSGQTCLLNALRPEVFRGEGPSSYARPGRIPRSVNVPHVSLLDAVGRFRPDDELREHFAAAGVLDPTTPVVAYCGGGISATVDLFALARAGREDARLYDGSLAEWTADPDLPVQTG
jgi:thiosulfate/3-mercaptopyruvate sulfurtransferase